MMAFYLHDSMCNILNVIAVDNIHVDLVNMNSGEIVYSSDSGNLNEYEE